MSVSQQLQLGHLFCEVKFVIFIMFESCDKTCSKHSCFDVDSVKFLRTHILQNNSEWLLYKTIFIIEFSFMVMEFFVPCGGSSSFLNFMKTWANFTKVTLREV